MYLWDMCILNAMMRGSMQLSPMMRQVGMYQWWSI